MAASLYLAPAQWTCGDDLTDNRDGQSYATVLIGSQCWMAENLNYGTMIQSNAPGHQMSDNGVVEKYCWNNVQSNCDNSIDHPGGYYEWQEAVQFYSGQPSQPVQGVCPDGWHIPSQSEYSALVSQLGGSNVAGGKMKVGGTSGFEGVIAGWRCTMNGGFLTLFPKGFWWTSNIGGSVDEGIYLDIDNTNTFATIGAYPASIGFNVRCIKNSTSSTNELIQQQGKIRITGIIHNNDLITLYFDSDIGGNGTIVVSSIAGREIKRFEKELNVGKNSYDLATNSLSPGIYIIKIANENSRVSEKVYIK